MSFAVVASFLKLERERKAVNGALCSPELKAKMLAELDARQALLEAQFGTQEQGASSDGRKPK